MTAPLPPSLCSTWIDMLISERGYSSVRMHDSNVCLMTSAASFDCLQHPSCETSAWSTACSHLSPLECDLRSLVANVAVLNSQVTIARSCKASLRRLAC